jgi:hypothetical protein
MILAEALLGLFPALDLEQDGTASIIRVASLALEFSRGRSSSPALQSIAHDELFEHGGSPFTGNPTSMNCFRVGPRPTTLADDKR